MAVSSAALVGLLVVSCAAAAAATRYTVGDGEGWTTGVNYNNWANGKYFKQGDELVFNYQNGAHTVTEVRQSDFDSCNGNNPLSNDNRGSTTIRLSYPGTHYFICTTQGHCSTGMKLAVTVNGDPSYSAGSVPAASAVAAAAAGALVKLALF
ncbi:mavicyanin-like [Oryza brachyantha]|uniref:mavicyanin-like n=1 Tax=Oryza brachyantha TaxID=4533 RepID=UPI001AD9EE7B|nr:mavicyanin-like [Oryza brachyantha]